MLGIHVFQFDGDFFARLNVDSQINITERASADLSAKPVFVGDSNVHIIYIRAEIALHQFGSVVSILVLGLG